MYTWSIIKAAMDDFRLRICDVRGSVEIRLLRSCQARLEVTCTFPLEMIEEAKASTPYDIEDTRKYLAFWEERLYYRGATPRQEEDLHSQAFVARHWLCAGLDRSRNVK